MKEKQKMITIRMTGNDLFYYWIKYLKDKLEIDMTEKNINLLKKKLRKTIKLMN